MRNTRAPRIEVFGFYKTRPYLDEPDGFGLLSKKCSGHIIAAHKVDYARPPQLPSYLRMIFNELRIRQQPVQLITVRKNSVPEKRDGSHLHQFLIPAEAPVQIVELTL